MNADPLAEWIAKAEEDYGGALDLARKRKNVRTNIISFLCQQCAEKYLKAFLVMQDIPFRKTHSLRELQNQCLEADPSFELLTNDLLALSHFAIDVRYPGANASTQEAREAVAAMKEVRKFVRARLGLK